MVSGPIIDAHLHLWNPAAIKYPWLQHNTLLNRPYLIEHYCAATAGVPIEAMVFVQCEADRSEFEHEARWAECQARLDPRIRGLVAWAPLEKGRAVRAELEKLMDLRSLRGIRRIIQFEQDLDFCLRPAFLDGVRLLRDFDLPFDICVDHRHLERVLEFAARITEVRLILDHIGKPAIKDGAFQPWAGQIRALARFPNVVCKISGVATEADHHHWTDDQLRPYVELATEAFGFDRIMFGGDWPVSTQAIGYRQWVDFLGRIFAGVSGIDQHKFWYANAASVYRLG